MALSVAQTILRQLGAGAFLTMVGGKELVDTGDGLRMTLGRNPRNVNRLTITLQGDDLYRVETGRYARLDYNIACVEPSIMVGDLHRTVERLTGLRTRL